MAHMYENVYFGNKIIPAVEANLSIASSAVLYGLSVYTVFTVCQDGNGNRLAFRIEDHYQRLLNSSKIIGIDTFEKEWTFIKFKKAVKELLSANTIESDIFVRATVHVDELIAGTRSRGLHTLISMFIYDAISILSAEACRLKTTTWRRIPDYAIPSRAKVNGAYVNSVLAKQDAIDSGYDDSIFIDVQGHVCELSAANIFMVRHGKLITPDTNSDLLEGINRGTVIELASKDLGIDVIERSIDLTELYIADEVFVTGTSVSISPVIEIDSRYIAKGTPGEITKKIQKIHYQLRHGEYKSSRKWLTKI